TARSAGNDPRQLRQQAASDETRRQIQGHASPGLHLLERGEASSQRFAFVVGQDHGSGTELNHQHRKPGVLYRLDARFGCLAPAKPAPLYFAGNGQILSPALDPIGVTRQLMAKEYLPPPFALTSLIASFEKSPIGPEIASVQIANRT